MFRSSSWQSHPPVFCWFKWFLNGQCRIAFHSSSIFCFLFFCFATAALINQILKGQHLRPQMSCLLSSSHTANITTASQLQEIDPLCCCFPGVFSCHRSFFFTALSALFQRASTQHERKDKVLFFSRLFGGELNQPQSRGLLIFQIWSGYKRSLCIDVWKN